MQVRLSRPRSWSTSYRAAVRCQSRWIERFVGAYGGPSSANRRQPRERSRAGAEPIRLDAEPLQHADVKIAQGRRVLRVEMQMLAMPESAARQQHRQVPDRMAAAVAQVAAEEDHRPVEQ